MIKFSIVITTKNRINDLRFTLESIGNLYNRSDVELLICDDASTDGTKDYLRTNFSDKTLIFNCKSKGLIYNRNVLNNLAKGDYIISIDDDLNFLSKNVLETIDTYFTENLNCGVISFRVFWGTQLPDSVATKDKSIRVKSFLGGAHTWRKKTWKVIPNYPDWFVFYGEEDFASYQLYKNDIEVHYVPAILAHHRVDLKFRKKGSDYYTRQRRSLRSGWYLFGLFYPKRIVPKRFLYSLYVQIKNKVVKGDIKMILSIVLALLDSIRNSPKIIAQSNRLTVREFKSYEKLPNTKIYWKPN